MASFPTCIYTHHRRATNSYIPGNLHPFSSRVYFNPESHPGGASEKLLAPGSFLAFTSLLYYVCIWSSFFFTTCPLILLGSARTSTIFLWPPPPPPLEKLFDCRVVVVRPFEHARVRNSNFIRPPLSLFVWVFGVVCVGSNVGVGGAPCQKSTMREILRGWNFSILRLGTQWGALFYFAVPHTVRVYKCRRRVVKSRNIKPKRCFRQTFFLRYTLHD